MKTCLKSNNILTPEGLKNGFILIDNGIIVDILNILDTMDIQNEFSNQEFPVTDYGDFIIMPALTDTHVHINEPGRSDWEGFETATMSAAAGGITTLADMPLNSSPVTIDSYSLNKKIKSAENKLYVDCGFYGGIIPQNTDKLQELIESGILGLKAFMIDSGIDEFPFVNENDLRNAMKIISKFKIPLLVHAEKNSGYIKEKNHNEYSYSSFLKSRPRKWENEAIDILIELSREFNAHIHIVHLSSSDAIEKIKLAKAEGLRITVETCPHYLYFSSEEIKDKETVFKCTPPIRESDNRELLWQAITEGIIDFIVSDHSPCIPELKCFEEGNFEKAWGGISSLQLGLSVVWTECRKRNLSIGKVSELMSRNTASFLGIGNFKGKIEKNYHADLLVFDPDKKFIVEEENLFHRHKKTPYNKRELYGTVEKVFLKGKKIFESGNIISAPEGKIIFNDQNSIYN